jgi:UDP-N-acetylmuramate--alanine ligase
MMFRRFSGLSHVHFVGIGGAGMSGIAEVLAVSSADESGGALKVSGCDLAASETTRRLARLGLEVSIGHSAGHIETADLVVISSAVGDDNEEVAAARRLGIPVVRRAEMLAELMRLKYGIAVAGTHGKTTTTSLVGALLTEAGLDPTVIVGGRLRVSGTGARLGKSDFLVVEADEFDRSFLRLQPIVAVITSIDVDHLDTYRDLDDIQDAFVNFASRVPFFGRAVVCLDDRRIQEVLPRLADRRVMTYGLSRQADLMAHQVETTARGSRFRVRQLEDRELGTVEIPLPGLHNVQNALAAVAVGLLMRLDFGTIVETLAGFSGVHRRFERLGEWRGAAVVDDYAHHPTEVAATLSAAREAFPEATVHAVFQPHLYSRTRDLAEEFGRSLLAADRVLVTPIYASREAPIQGVSARMIVDVARRSGHRHVELVGSNEEAIGVLSAEVTPGDLVLTMGAGDIYRLAEQLVAAAEAQGGIA